MTRPRKAEPDALAATQRGLSVQSGREHQIAGRRSEVYGQDGAQSAARRHEARPVGLELKPAGSLELGRGEQTLEFGKAAGCFIDPEGVEPDYSGIIKSNRH